MISKVSGEEDFVLFWRRGDFGRFHAGEFHIEAFSCRVMCAFLSRHEIDALPAQVYNHEFVGMIWMQGERDSKDSDMASAYAVNLENFITATRKDFKSPGMCFVAGRVNPPKNKFLYVDKVRKAQKDCMNSNYAFIDCDNLEKGNDNVHYSTKGIRAMGQKFAETMLELINKK